ncbi:MAG: hypothetical protein HRT45_07815 [Bdellovibrionales bacterium]|nr:hypothetical protein [Bdellovibrionales bacterium]
MKAIISVLLFVTALQAQARTPQRYTEVSLDVVSISKTSPLASEDLIGGMLVIDHYTDSAQLILHKAAPVCPPGLYCTLAMPAPIIIEFDNLQSEQDACGSFTFTAIIDDTAFDGLVETLEIVDNTFNKCMHLDVLDQFEVTYATYAPRSRVTSEAKFRGPKEDFITLPVQPYAAM